NQIQNDSHPDRMGDADSELPPFIVVPLIRDARFADAVGKHPLDEQPIHRRRIVLERVNSARDYTQWRFSDLLGDEPDALPGIFFEFPNCLLQMRTRNYLDAFKPRVIHSLGDGQHHAGRHILRLKALMSVAQRGIDEANGVHVSCRYWQESYWVVTGNSTTNATLPDKASGFFLTPFAVLVEAAT